MHACGNSLVKSCNITVHLAIVNSSSCTLKSVNSKLTQNIAMAGIPLSSYKAHDIDEHVQLGQCSRVSLKLHVTAECGWYITTCNNVLRYNTKSLIRLKSKPIMSGMAISPGASYVRLYTKLECNEKISTCMFCCCYRSL